MLRSSGRSNSTNAPSCWIRKSAFGLDVPGRTGGVVPKGGNSTCTPGGLPQPREARIAPSVRILSRFSSLVWCRTRVRRITGLYPSRVARRKPKFADKPGHCYQALPAAVHLSTGWEAALESVRKTGSYFLHETPTEI